MKPILIKQSLSFVENPNFCFTNNHDGAFSITSIFLYRNPGIFFLDAFHRGRDSPLGVNLPVRDYLGELPKRVLAFLLAVYLR